MDQYAYYESPDSDIQLPAKLPEKFSATDLPKFKTKDHPTFHLKGFRATMTMKGVYPILYTKVFPLSLDPVCQKWFFSLSDKDIATWEDITHAFMTRYKGNTHVCTSLRELEILKQTEKEGFTTYLARWKEVATQMVYHIGIEIEDDLLKAYDSNNSGKNNKNKGKWGNSNYFNNKKNDTSSSSKGVNSVDVNAGKGHTTEECWTLKNKLQDMVESGQLPVPPGGKKPNTDTSPFTVLMISAEEAPFDPANYMTPVGQELPPISELPNHHHINNIGDED
ncbi:Cilia- and flagella-associated protein 43 [Bienertia sinuspersici]